MKLPISWLNDYVDVKDIEPKELAKMLLNIGFEVEEIIYMGQDIENVVVGKILDVKKHMDADKLKVCMVDVGKEITTIVTGAANVAAGNFVPIALDGAKLPGGKEIVASPLRGVMSYGMMCSGGELNIDNSIIDGAEVDGILLLDKEYPLGQDIKTVLGIDEYILDVSLTANRPDCQSIYGMAREVGAILNRKVKPLNLKYKVKESDKTQNVKIENYELCSRYTGTLVEDIKLAPSPRWMKLRLKMVGIRPINNVVDITNYVLTEVGQPLHAFDTSKLSGSIIVRSACQDEEITALNGQKYKLNSNMLVIADEEKSLAIAGVMGGEYSGINEQTKSVLLEAARFSRGSIRATSRALGLRSDSSARFEKGVDWQSIDSGRERALALFCSLNVGKVTSIKCVDEIETPKPKKITTSCEQISNLLGIKVKGTSITKILKALSFDVEQKNDKLVCTVPQFREDVDNFTDLAEEVIRFYGYDNITSTLLKTASTTEGGLSVRQKNINDIKSVLCQNNCYEINTYSFINTKQLDKLNIDKDDELRNEIKLLNPLSEEYAVMRTQMASNMLNTIYTNVNRKNDNFRLFEIGRTYIASSIPLKELPKENETLCMGFVGKNENFYTLKSVVTDILRRYNIQYSLLPGKKSYLHPGISADIIVNGKVIGWFGKIHPLVTKNYELGDNNFIAELNCESFLDETVINAKFIPLPKFPVVERDLAVIVKNECTAGEMISVINSAAGDICHDVKIFDIYSGGQIESGYKSVAFSIKLCALTRTLIDSEIQEVINKILYELNAKFEAKLRV